MPLTTTELNAAMDSIKTRYTHASVHTADPGSTGTSEATGGSPAYARQAITWGSSSGTGDVVSNQMTFDVAAGTYTHGGLWSALTAGTFRGGFALSPNQTISGQGQIKVTVTLDGSTT